MSRPPFVPLILTLAAAASVAGPPPVCGQPYPEPRAETGGRAAPDLHALFEEHWEWTLRTNPVFAGYLGDARFNDRWPDVSPDALRERHEERQAFLARAEAIDPAGLPAADRLNRRLFLADLGSTIDEWDTGWHLLPLSAREGIQDAGSVADALTFETPEQFRNWTARMRAFPEYMTQTLGLLDEGIKTGRTHARVVMDRVPGQIRAQIVEDPERSLFYKPFRDMPASIPADEAEQLREDARAAIREEIVPAYETMLAFFESRYLPACYEEVGIHQWPAVPGRFLDGKGSYAVLARKFTTTDLTPDQIHEIGLSEVERIRGEMEGVMKEVGFGGTFAEFLVSLRENPDFYYGTAEELIDGYRTIIRSVDPKLAEQFGTLPRIPYDVQAIPAHIAPDTTTAYYREPAADGSRPGTFFVNLYKPESRPKYEMEALALHEAVPGHHLQIARAIELGDLPNFRRFGGTTAYIEGWALYSEQLGDELGLYTDPYSRFGQLTYEMWRAIRLVVDTGMHDRGWSRERAIEFFLANAAKTRLDVVNEIDRYIAWPGQALAYKIGELKITALRRRAEAALGDRFDVKAFHDAVLDQGPVPLDVLEETIDAWIAEQRP